MIGKVRSITSGAHRPRAPPARGEGVWRRPLGARHRLAPTGACPGLRRRRRTRSPAPVAESEERIDRIPVAEISSAERLVDHGNGSAARAIGRNEVSPIEIPAGARATMPWDRDHSENQTERTASNGQQHSFRDLAREPASRGCPTDAQQSQACSASEHQPRELPPLLRSLLARLIRSLGPKAEARP